jgi:hypothetical protein
VEASTDTSMPSSVVASGKVQLPDHPGFWCGELNEKLAEQLIARTLDAGDIRLREMTHDLARFSSSGQLKNWRPGRDLVCLQDDDETLFGLGWLADKALPERDDYFDPELMRERSPDLTCAIRTYGPARGRGLLTLAFAETSLEILLRRRPRATSIWYETKAANDAARALGRQMGFTEVSGEEGGSVIGVRFL